MSNYGWRFIRDNAVAPYKYSRTLMYFSKKNGVDVAKVSYRLSREWGADVYENGNPGSYRARAFFITRKLAMKWVEQTVGEMDSMNTTRRLYAVPTVVTVEGMVFIEAENENAASLAARQWLREQNVQTVFVGVAYPSIHSDLVPTGSPSLVIDTRRLAHVVQKAV